MAGVGDGAAVVDDDAADGDEDEDEVVAVGLVLLLLEAAAALAALAARSSMWQPVQAQLEQPLDGSTLRRCADGMRQMQPRPLGRLSRLHALQHGSLVVLFVVVRRCWRDGDCARECLLLVLLVLLLVLEALPLLSLCCCCCCCCCCCFVVVPLSTLSSISSASPSFRMHSSVSSSVASAMPLGGCVVWLCGRDRSARENRKIGDKYVWSAGETL